MALLAPQAVTKTGMAVAFAAAAAGGDTFVPNSRGVLLVKNASGVTITATVIIPGNTEYGQPNPDVAVPVAAAGQAAIGPFSQTAADVVTGLITIAYSAVTSVTVAYISV